MSKITFRAEDELIAQVERFDASKSEVMRSALRDYIDSDSDNSGHQSSELSPEELDAIIAERIDEILSDRLDQLMADRLDQQRRSSNGQDVNVNITLDGVASPESATGDVATDEDSSPTEQASDGSLDDRADKRQRSDFGHSTDTCSQCGEPLDDSHVHCPNCGEKAARRVFCECGCELRSDWSFCPDCGRQTPAADVLDNL